MHGTFDKVAPVWGEVPEGIVETLPDGRSIGSASKEELVEAAAELRRTAESYRAWARAIDRLALLHHLGATQAANELTRSDQE